MGIALLVLVSCKETATTTPATTPDYAAFDKKVAVIRDFYKAHCDENLPALAALLADTVKYSPPYYNGNKWLGKEDFLAALKAYHENYENIKYIEGIVTADSVAGGFYSGSVYPKESATTNSSNIRVYGTWTGTHTKSGQNVGIKYYALISVNADGKITNFSDYFDINSLIPKETATK